MNELKPCPARHAAEQIYKVLGIKNNADGGITQVERLIEQAFRRMSEQNTRTHEDLSTKIEGVANPPVKERSAEDEVVRLIEALEHSIKVIYKLGKLNACNCHGRSEHLSNCWVGFAHDAILRNKILIEQITKRLY